MNRWYVDTSVAAHAVLPMGGVAAIAWLDARRAEGDELYSSTLLRLELVRALRREQLPVSFAEAITGRLSELSIDDRLLRAADSIEPHVRSLDAIHLAACLRLGTDVRLVTHDRAMGRAAATLGLTTFDPLDQR